MSGGSSLGASAAGRIVAAPAYRQAVLEQMRNGWQRPEGGTIKKS